jgi:hypothetical protein
MHTVTCKECALLIDGFSVGWIGFIDTLYTHIVTSINYRSVAISTLYSSLLHILVPWALTSRIWQRIHNSLTMTAAHYEVSFVQPNSFLAISSQSTVNCQLSTPQILSSLCCNCQLRNSTQFSFYLREILLYSLGAAPTENSASSIVACWFTTAEKCLPHCCVTTVAALTTENTVLVLLGAFS